MVKLANLLISVYALVVMIYQTRMTKAAGKNFALSTNSSSTVLENQCSQMLCQNPVTTALKLIAYKINLYRGSS